MDELRDAEMAAVQEARKPFLEYGVVLRLWVRCDAERTEMIAIDEATERLLASLRYQDGPES